MITSNLTETEALAWTITRREGIRNINEAIAALKAAGINQTFAPFGAIRILEEKRAELCAEIRELSEVRS